MPYDPTNLLDANEVNVGQYFWVNPHVKGYRLPKVGHDGLVHRTQQNVARSNQVLFYITEVNYPAKHRGSKRAVNTIGLIGGNVEVSPL